MHDCYGIDTGDDALMSARSWRWLRSRISGLLARPPVYVPDGEGGATAVPSTRLGLALNPPN